MFLWSHNARKHIIWTGSSFCLWGKWQWNERYEEIDYLISLPITIPIILLLVLFSRKINNYSLTRELRINIDNEIDDVFFDLYDIDKIQLDILEENFIKLKNEKNKVKWMKLY